MFTFMFTAFPLWKLAIPQKVWPKSIEKGERKSTGGCFLCLAPPVPDPPAHSLCREWLWLSQR